MAFESPQAFTLEDGWAHRGTQKGSMGGRWARTPPCAPRACSRGEASRASDRRHKRHERCRRAAATPDPASATSRGWRAIDQGECHDVCQSPRGPAVALARQIQWGTGGLSPACCHARARLFRSDRTHRGGPYQSLRPRAAFWSGRPEHDPQDWHGHGTAHHCAGLRGGLTGGGRAPRCFASGR